MVAKEWKELMMCFGLVIWELTLLTAAVLCSGILKSSLLNAESHAAASGIINSLKEGTN